MPFSTYNQQLQCSIELTDTIRSVQAAYDMLVAARSKAIAQCDRMIEMRLGDGSTDPNYEPVQANYGFLSNTHAHETVGQFEALKGHLSANPATKPVGEILAAMKQFLDRLPKV